LFLLETFMSNSFPATLKQLRGVANKTQKELAVALGIARSTIAGYETGRKEPDIASLLGLSKYFKTSVHYLLTGRAYENILAITVDKDKNEFIEFVPIAARAGYLAGYGDPEYIEGLTRFNLPALSVGTYRAFEIKGDSMPPIEEGTIVIGKYVDSSMLRNGHRYIIVHKQDGIVFKRIIKEDNFLIGRSDNPTYPEIHIEHDEIVEVWEFHTFIASAYKHGMEYENIAQKLTIIESKLNKLSSHG
jgi:transcriptional regulator with XRE-family HTH domain